MPVIDAYIQYAIDNNASDLHITVGKPPVLRVDGELVEMENTAPLTPGTVADMLLEIVPDQRKDDLAKNGDVDFAYVALSNRLRANVYRQRGSYAAALRVLSKTIPTLDELGHPAVLKNLALLQRGLVLITGPTGSGKSTTLAAMIDYANNTKTSHIITIEDPIEYLHRHKKCIINQRELNEDTLGFDLALRAALREDPDIVLVGEMRDLETVRAAITAAETGHLVLSTLHTTGAASTVDRIIDVFPPSQQPQVRIQLSETLQGVVSQQLLPRKERKGRIAALEIMIKTDAISNLVREGKSHQIENFIQTGRQYGMQMMDAHLAELVRTGTVDLKEARKKCVNLSAFERYLQ
ncbi:MAG: type IV pilus twitching motility protein PilT [Christensenellales bacterium]|jgi:twitching motility protein PilT